MSQESVEVARRLYSLRPDAAGIVRGDFDDVFLDYFQPDVEIVPPSSYPDTPTSSCRGQDGLRPWFQHVVFVARVGGSAKQSGAALAISAAHVLTLRACRVSRGDRRFYRR